MSDYDPVSKADVLETYADLYDIFEDNKAICKELDKIYDRLNTLPPAEPESHYDEWCDDCKEYDKERHCCPRWNKVIRETLKDVHTEQRWIPCSETIDIPDYEVLCCDRHGEELIGWLSYNNDQWFCESDGGIVYDPIAWRELPEPYREEGEQDGQPIAASIRIR